MRSERRTKPTHPGVQERIGLAPTLSRMQRLRARSGGRVARPRPGWREHRGDAAEGGDGAAGDPAARSTPTRAVDEPARRGDDGLVPRPVTTQGIVKLSEVGAVANHISLMRHI